MSTSVIEYPRPTLVRVDHLLLDRVVDFAYDDADLGRHQRWQDHPERFDRSIRLPFCPESTASGIGDTTFHPVLWYRIPIDGGDLQKAGRGVQGDRMMLRFEAVDYSCDVWVDGRHVLHHEGGQIPFGVDITSALDESADEHSIVIRAEDDPHDVTMPRGKQDWLLEPHGIWYNRTSGIWRSVWLEAVSDVFVESIGWRSDVVNGVVHADIELNRRPVSPLNVTIELSVDGEFLAVVTTRVTEANTELSVSLAGQRNGQHYYTFLWSPENPQLIDAEVSLSAPDGAVTDRVSSYLGLRSVEVESGQFLLNGLPCYVRAVLEQGYWPETHLTAPSNDALKAEVELIKSLGFNTARVHQKVEDRRFLYWADRLGLMIWGETANAYEFSAKAVERLTAEWTQIVLRDRSNPSVVMWVPFNESWGIQHIARDPQQQAYSLALTHLTRALDPTRPVISNDGWEHTDSDVWALHDYEQDGTMLTEKYRSRAEVDASMNGIWPMGRRVTVGAAGRIERGQPVMLTEFGGITYTTRSEGNADWSYSTTTTIEAYETRLREIMTAVVSSPVLAGFCYTQLTDTLQERNGLCDENRVPKLPVDVIFTLIT